MNAAGREDFAARVGGVDLKGAALGSDVLEQPVRGYDGSSGSARSVPLPRQYRAKTSFSTPAGTWRTYASRWPKANATSKEVLFTRGTPPLPRRQYRNAIFPVLYVAALAGVSLLTSVASRWMELNTMAIQGALGASGGAAAAGGISVGLAVAAGVLGLAAITLIIPAVAELAAFAWVMRRGRNVTDEQAVPVIIAAKEQLARSAPNLASVLSRPGSVQIWRPQSRASSFAYTEDSVIFIRPEATVSPWITKLVLRHEAKHVRDRLARGPPRGHGSARNRAAEFLWTEIIARALDFVPERYLKYFLRTPLWERVEREMGVDLASSGPIEVLLVNPSTSELSKASILKRFSRKRARIVQATYPNGPSSPFDLLKFCLGDKAKLQDVFKDKKSFKRFRTIVLSKVFKFSDPSTLHGKQEAMRLALALKHLDRLHALIERVRAAGSIPLSRDSPLAVELERLTGSRLPLPHGRTASSEQYLSRLWDMSVATHLKDIDAVQVIEGAYGSLQNRGMALVPWEGSKSDFEIVEKLFRYWRGRDLGKFKLRRLDIPEDGSVLMAVKSEPMVEMWIKPIGGRVIRKSYINILGDPQAAGKPREILRAAGFKPEEIKKFLSGGLDGKGGFNGPQEAVLLAAGFSPEQVVRFRDTGPNGFSIEVLHAFDGKLKRRGNTLFIQIPRVKAKIFRRYADQERSGDSESFRIESVNPRIKPHLADSAPMQNVPQVWRAGIAGKTSGKIMKVYEADTGVDRRHIAFTNKTRIPEQDDLVGSGTGDLNGHGTHTLSTIIGNPPDLHKGMAFEAEGRMAKVFPDKGEASDGVILAAGVNAVEGSFDVASFSLGGPGWADSPLAAEFSDLALQKNSEGSSTVFAASAGNSGSWDFTVGEPAAGPHVIASAAAAKNKDDGAPEVAFYSSVGPSIFGLLYQIFGLERFGWKPEITAVGGDAGNEPGQDSYPQGVEAGRSPESPRSPSDTPDGLFTRMSGTSMSNPMTVGIILLVKLGIWLTADRKSEAYRYYMDNTSFAIKMILMQSARDMSIPAFVMGAGFVDAWAAVQLGAATFGTKPVKLLEGAGSKGFEWVRTAKAIWDAENDVYSGAMAAAVEAMKEYPVFQDLILHGFSEDDMRLRKAQVQAAKKAKPHAQRRFAELAEAAAPGIAEALDVERSPEWITRAYAAFTLMNLRSSQALQALTQTALKDPDARVRQMAFMAVAAMDANADIDAQIKAAVESAALSEGANNRIDVALYGAYVLSSHGDHSQLSRIVDAFNYPDKAVRYTAVWLAGHVVAPGTQIAEGLADKVIETGERGNIRHRAIVSIFNILARDPDQVSDRAIRDVVRMADPQPSLPSINSTIAEFTSNVQGKQRVAQRMRQGSLREFLTQFVMEHRTWAGSDSALGKIVRSLAAILDIPLGTLGQPSGPQEDVVPDVYPGVRMRAGIEPKNDGL